MTREVDCIKLGRKAEGLAKPPVAGDLGQRIYESISKDAWREWLLHQTRLINEYQLVLADPKAREFLTGEMEKYFFGGGDLAETHYIPPEEAGPSD